MVELRILKHLADGWFEMEHKRWILEGPRGEGASCRQRSMRETMPA